MRKWHFGIVVACLLAGMMPLSAAAGTSGSVTATVPIAMLSITVAPSTVTFGQCGSGNSLPDKLGFPNGICFAPAFYSAATAIIVTNTGAAGHIDITGSNAVPADNLTPWTLCDEGPSCTGPSNRPGQDQAAVRSLGVVGVVNGPFLSTNPQCDTAFSAGCAAATGQNTAEFLQLTGPTASTDGSDTFTIHVTWTAVP